MSLIAHWKCDDNAASTTVVATVGTNATLNGGDNTSAKTVAGPGGSITAGLDLNGTDDRIDITASSLAFASGSAFSFSIWVKPKGANVRFTGLGIPATDRLATGLDDNTIIRLIDTGGSSVTFTVPALGTSWRHVLVTKTSGNNARVFVDGTESSSGAKAFASTLTMNYLGFNANAYTNGLAVAQVKIFDSDESANVATLYAEGVGGAAAKAPPPFAAFRRTRFFKGR